MIACQQEIRSVVHELLNVSLFTFVIAAIRRAACLTALSNLVPSVAHTLSTVQVTVPSMLML